MLQVVVFQRVNGRTLGHSFQYLLRTKFSNRRLVELGERVEFDRIDTSLAGLTWR